jgi:hypothetical protein
LSIDEANVVARQVAQAVDSLWIALAEKEALFAPRQMHEHVTLRIEPAPIGIGACCTELA